MSDHTGDFRVSVESPHGQQAVEQFAHFLNKVADEARERWGIAISVERLEGEQLPENGGFQE